jgi:hypothetical protein
MSNSHSVKITFTTTVPTPTIATSDNLKFFYNMIQSHMWKDFVGGSPPSDDFDAIHFISE